ARRRRGAGRHGHAAGRRPAVLRPPYSDSSGPPLRAVNSSRSLCSGNRPLFTTQRMYAMRKPTNRVARKERHSMKPVSILPNVIAAALPPPPPKPNPPCCGGRCRPPPSLLLPHRHVSRHRKPGKLASTGLPPYPHHQPDRRATRATQRPPP